jgi:hypothetical protein
MTPASECCKTEIAPENSVPVDSCLISPVSVSMKCAIQPVTQFYTISAAGKGQLVLNDDFVFEGKAASFEAFTPGLRQKNL